MIKFRRMVIHGEGERGSRLEKTYKVLKQNLGQIWPNLWTKQGGQYVGIRYIALYDSVYAKYSIIKIM